MQRRILMSMLTIALAAAMVGGATVAVFTAQDRTSNQVGFTAGTVQVEAGEIVVTESVNLSNLAPGDTVSGSFEVSNTGTLEVYYIVEPVATGYLFEQGANPARVHIPEEYITGVIKPNDTATVEFKVTLPFEAGNEYQGKTGSLYFVIKAQQVKWNDQPDWNWDLGS